METLPPAEKAAELHELVVVVGELFENTIPLPRFLESNKVNPPAVVGGYDSGYGATEGGL